MSAEYNDALSAPDDMRQLWAARLGTVPGTIHNRIRYGWSIEKAMTPPVSKSGMKATVH